MSPGIPRPLKILVVDDDETFNHALEARLSKAGFFMDSVLDGESALAKIATQHFDLVVLDLIMPKMTGFEVLRAMGKKEGGPHVVVLSRLRQEDDLRLAKELGASECFPKESATFMDDIVEYARKLSIS
jgi:DNA-binding response OmpR family regulator